MLLEHQGNMDPNDSILDFAQFVLISIWHNVEPVILKVWVICAFTF